MSDTASGSGGTSGVGRQQRRARERERRKLAKRTQRHGGTAPLMPLFAFLIAPGVLALPVDGKVVSGDVAIGQAANNTLPITQSSPKGIVNWKAFSIGGNETVNIRQPNASAVLLNRVTGTDASVIAGHLNANGRVFLVNPAGVLFAPGASVNAGSLVASTLGISDKDFLAGKYRFTSVSGLVGAGVVNQGTITAASGGTVAMLGAQVDNQGTVSAKLGTVALGAGSDITLDFAGDGLTMLKINGAAADALVANSGAILADGGLVVMSVQNADALAGTVLNQQGVVRAQSVAERDGRILLDGGGAGETQVAGLLDATGGAGMTGGHIDVTGYHVALQEGARVDASGAAGGGRVRFGGGAAGADADLHNAQAVWMAPDAQIHADALANGAGGQVVAFGIDAARVYGMLTARGGPQGGNGGKIETSGHYLDLAQKQIDASAPMGVGGQWIIDPGNLEIGEVIDLISANSTPGSRTPPVAATYTPNGANSLVLARDISTQLSDGVSVIVSTGTGGPGQGNITFDAGSQISKVGAAGSVAPDATLTLSAAGSITLSGQIGGTSNDPFFRPGQAPSGRLNVVADANLGLAAAGTNRITLNGAQILTNGGSVSLGVAAAAANPATSFDGASIGITNSEIDTRGLAANGASNGAILIHGQGAYVQPPPPPPAVVIEALPVGTLSAVNIDTSRILTGAGALDIQGQQGNADTGTQPGGVALTGASAIASTSGAINITGLKNGGGAVSAVGGSISSASGPVTVLGGTSSGNAVNLDGVAVATAGAIAMSGSSLDGGGISINGGTIGSTGGPVTLQGGSATGGNGVGLTAAALSSTAGGITIEGSAGLGDGVSIIGGSLNSGAGLITIQGSSSTRLDSGRGSSGNGVSVARDAIIQTQTGAIDISGIGPVIGGTTSSVTGTGVTFLTGTVGSTGGAISIDGTGPTVSNPTGSVSGTGVSMTGATISSTTGPVSVVGAGPTVTGTPPAVTGDGVDLINNTQINSTSGAIAITGTAMATTNTLAQINGDGVRLSGFTIGSGTGNVSIVGSVPAGSATNPAFQTPSNGVDISTGGISSGSGSILIEGSASPGTIYGYGVHLSGGFDALTTITGGAGGTQLFGSGNGFAGVYMIGGQQGNVSVTASTGKIDIRGLTDGRAFTSSGIDTFSPAVDLNGASIRANGDGQTVSITGSTPSTASGISANNTLVHAGTNGTIVLRASNTGTASPLAIASGNTLETSGGTLVLVPGSVAPTTFAIVPDNTATIDIGGSGPGFSISPALLGATSSNIDTIVIGSNTHTGSITLNAFQNETPFFNTSLTLQNTGTNSGGISLPAGLDAGFNTLTLASTGPVTQGDAIRADSLLLNGTGNFTLTNAGNHVLNLAMVGTGIVDYQNAGDLFISSLAGSGFDTATGTVTTITGNGSTPTRDVTIGASLGAADDLGFISLNVPITKNTGGDATLTLRANNSIFAGSDIVSTSGALNLQFQAGFTIAAQSAGEGQAFPIRFLTNGGNVTFSTQDGLAGVPGAYVSLQSTRLDTRTGAAVGAPTATGGAVTIRAAAPAIVEETGEPYAIDLNNAQITTGSGSVTLAGQSLAAATGPGTGVVLRNTVTEATANPGPSFINTGSGGISISGTGRGAGNAGIAVLDGASITTNSGGSVDLRGSSLGAAPGVQSGNYGVLLANGSIAANAAGSTIAIAGSTTTADAGIGIGAVPLPPNAGFATGPFTLATGQNGTIALRSANSGSSTSLLGRGAPASINAPGGVLAIAPASVDPSSFAITPQNGISVTLFGSSTAPGLSIDPATYQSFSPTLQTLVLGSPTQTGAITVNGACAGGATTCAAPQRPSVATSLTLLNPASGSSGIALPYGVSMPGKTLALDSAGPVTDPNGIQAAGLLLAGNTDFILTDAGNDVGTLAISNANNVMFSNPGSFAIGPLGAQSFDWTTQSVTAIGATDSTLSGKLQATSTNGSIALGATTVRAGGTIDVVMENGVFSNPGNGRLVSGDAWHVWASTWQGETRGGLDPGGAQPNFYGCSFPGTCSWPGNVPLDANHFVYVARPSVRVDIGDQVRVEGAPNGPFGFTTSGLVTSDTQGNALTAGPLTTTATPASPPGRYPIDGTFSSPVGYLVTVVPGTLTITPPPERPIDPAIFNRTGLQPLFTAQEQSFVYESNLGGINICVGSTEPILALQQPESVADSLAVEWKRVRSRPNLNSCLVVNGEHGCGEF